MAIQITATVADTASIWLVDTRLTSFDPILDPVAYVQDPEVYGEILSRAGLDEGLSLVDARLISTGSVEELLTYEMQITFGVPPENTMTHSHDSSTARVGLGDSYGVSPLIALNALLGPVVIEYGDNTTLDYLRVRTDTDTAARDLFFVQRTEAQFGLHQTFVADATFDIGSADGGATPKRPRDIYLSRDLFVGRNISIVGTLTTGALDAGYTLYQPLASNPEPDPAKRLVYVNLDGTLRYWDGSSETILGASGAGTPTQGNYTCPGGVTVGDVVYSTGVDTVGRATAALLDGAPPLGVVTDKPTGPTSCIVRYIGEIPIYSGLAPGKRYWVGRTAGIITDDDTLFAEDETACSIGIAKSTTTLVLLIGDPKRI